jgi:hypothetical protein
MIFCLSILILSGCSSKTIIGKNDNTKEVNTITTERAADLIAVPDQIIYYHQGKETIIDKSNVKYQNIISMAINRTDSVNDMCQLYISRPEIETLKQNNDVLEFAYSKEVTAQWKAHADSDFKYKFVYNAILFPLSGDWKKFMIFMPNPSGPIGPMGSAEDLQKYLNS